MTHTETIRQYYFKSNKCKAYSAYDQDCICWHDEGSGPYKDAKETDLSREDLSRGDVPKIWRDKPHGKFTILIDTCSERGHNYAKLLDHPTTEYGQPICPHCVYVGLMRARAEVKELRKLLGEVQQGG